MSEMSPLLQISQGLFFLERYLTMRLGPRQWKKWRLKNYFRSLFDPELPKRRKHMKRQKKVHTYSPRNGNFRYSELFFN